MQKVWRKIILTNARKVYSEYNIKTGFNFPYESSKKILAASNCVEYFKYRKLTDNNNRLDQILKDSEQLRQADFCINNFKETGYTEDLLNEILVAEKERLAQCAEYIDDKIKRWELIREMDRQELMEKAKKNDTSSCFRSLVKSEDETGQRKL